MRQTEGMDDSASGIGFRAPAIATAREWRFGALLAFLTPLAAILAAIVLAGFFAPWGVLLPLALGAFNVLRLVRTIAVFGPSVGRVALVVVNAALVAAILSWLIAQ